MKKVMGPEALLRMKVKQRRFREGYAEGLSTSHKALSALGFVASDTPVEVLGQFTQIALNGPPSWVAVEGLDADVDAVKELAAVIRGHEATSAEVRELCGDLQVLGRTEFKTLLRWRLALRKALAGKLGVETSEASAHKKKKPKKGERRHTRARASQRTAARAAMPGRGGAGRGSEGGRRGALLLCCLSRRQLLLRLQIAECMCVCDAPVCDVLRCGRQRRRTRARVRARARSRWTRRSGCWRRWRRSRSAWSTTPRRPRRSGAR